MSRTYAFRIVNVFAETTFGGNPLCVFEDARGLSDDEMRALARQFNLSETTFILPSETADAHVRIFTPGYEMRFAGHPTLGTAHVLRAMRGLGDQITLQFAAGRVPVEASGDHWTLTAPSSGEPKISKASEADADIAALVRLGRDDLAQSPQWVDTGADQLLIPLRNAETVARAQPDSARLERWPLSSLGRKTGYVFSIDGERGGELDVTARYFFTTQGGGGAFEVTTPGWRSSLRSTASRLRSGRQRRIRPVSFHAMPMKPITVSNPVWPAVIEEVVSMTFPSEKSAKNQYICGTIWHFCPSPATRKPPECPDCPAGIAGVRDFLTSDELD